MTGSALPHPFQDEGESKQAPGLAVTLDLQGVLQKVIWDGFGISSRVAPGQLFTAMLDRGSMSKGLGFLAEVRARGAAFDWEMNIHAGDGIATLHFAGVTNEDHILLVGARTRLGILQLYEELMRINNEQVNALRLSMKEQAGLAHNRVERDTALYDQITRLNNELVVMQRELARKNAELARLNEQKNQFLGMAAHDLRNPLSAIMTYSSFLMDDLAGALNAEHREFLETIHASSEFMSKLVNDLLDIAKIESGRLQLALQEIDLVPLVRRNVAMGMLMASRKRIELRLYDTEVPPVLADPPKIEQVLDNLIGNAIKFSHPGTRIEVRLGPAEDGKAAGGVLLSVKDEGQGIPEHEFHKLFEPFERTSVKSTAGETSTGLGLAIVRRIVNGHGGRIWVESEVGKGSTFYVYLPAAGAQPVEPAE